MRGPGGPRGAACPQSGTSCSAHQTISWPILFFKPEIFPSLATVSWESTTLMGDRDSLGPAKQAQFSRRCDTIAAFVMAPYQTRGPAVPAAGLAPSLLYDVSDKFPAMPG